MEVKLAYTLVQVKKKYLLWHSASVKETWQYVQIPLTYKREFTVGKTENTKAYSLWNATSTLNPAIKNTDVYFRFVYYKLMSPIYFIYSTSFS